MIEFLTTLGATIVLLTGLGTFLLFCIYIWDRVFTEGLKHLGIFAEFIYFIFVRNDEKYKKGEQHGNSK